MKKLILATLVAFLAFGMQSVRAADASPSDCETKAVSKNGKKLAGAAKATFMKKCAGGAEAAPPAAGCEEKAVGKNGKKLAGAAKNAFMKKCEADAKAAQ